MSAGASNILNDVVCVLRELVSDLDVEINSRRPMLSETKHAGTKVHAVDLHFHPNSRETELKVAAMIAESAMYHIYSEIMHVPQYAVIGVNVLSAHRDSDPMTMDTIGRVSYQFILD